LEREIIKQSKGVDEKENHGRNDIHFIVGGKGVILLKYSQASLALSSDKCSVKVKTFK
jgi:hypothetical protein